MKYTRQSAALLVAITVTMVLLVAPPGRAQDTDDCTDEDSTYCSDLGSSGCYAKVNQKACCATCKEHDTRYYRLLGKPNKGDDDSSDCPSGDLAPSCADIQPSSCYKEAIRERCCETCQQHEESLSAGDGCEYGDQDVDSCRFVNMRHCKGSYSRQKCCASCARFTE